MNRKRKGQQRDAAERLRKDIQRSELIKFYRLIDRARGNIEPRVTTGFGWIHVKETK